MMGMLDDIIGGIDAAGETPPAGEAPPAQGGEKPLHSYSDGFKAQYGERKKPA